MGLKKGGREGVPGPNGAAKETSAFRNVLNIEERLTEDKRVTNRWR